MVPLFDIKREANIPTFFSSLLLTIAALLLWLISRAEAAKKASWALLSVGILLMAIDEIVQFHEDLTNPARWLLGEMPRVFFITLGSFLAWAFQS
ncbi:MAG: hypothetical protein VKN83_00700 [Cyanobacteriota bacterium]|nr:hypothetical protein [Cyanobacteriota bacterium]